MGTKICKEAKGWKWDNKGEFSSDAVV